jgi:acetyl esterase/lipase
MRLPRCLLPLGLALLLGACAQAPRQPESAPAADEPQDPALAAVFGGCRGVQPQPETLAGARSFTYAKASGRELRIHLFESAAGPAEARPAVLFFFGGGWRAGRVESFQRQARAFVDAGYVALLADYRVKCRDGTTPLASLEDARAAYAWLRAQAPRLGVDRSRIVLAGGSAGGHLALATAQKAVASGEQPAALWLLNPAVDLFGPAPWYLKPAALAISPSLLPVWDLPPTLIQHGEADVVVPIASVQAFCERARSRERVCELQRYPGLGHSFYHRRTPEAALQGRSAYQDTLARAFDFLVAQGLPGAAP